MLTGGEIPVSPEQLWTGASEASTGLVVGAAKDRATLANHSSAFARDTSERDGCGFQESQEEACKLPSGKFQGQPKKKLHWPSKGKVQGA